MTAHICIVALIGLPAVGKTTFSKLLLDIEALPFNVLHICYDEFISSQPNTSTTSYKEQRDYLLKSLRATLESLKRSSDFISNSNLINAKSCTYKESDSGFDRVLIICDDNHYYRSMRYKLYQIARQLGLSYGQICFQCNVEIALRRNYLRSTTEQIPGEVFHKMSVLLETPQLSSHFWEKNTFYITTDKINKSDILSEIVPFITQLFDSTIQPLKSLNDNCAVTQSRVHDLDILIRKRIGLLMNSNDKINKRLIAQLLNNKRKDMLKEFQRKSDFDQCLRLFEEYLYSITDI